MKKIKIYFAALIAAFAVTMGALPVAAEQNTANGFNMPEYYVETALENEIGKEKYFTAYNAIKSGVENFESKIRLGTEADRNEIWMIFNSYRSDHPEHFWLNPVTLSSGRYVYADGTCESFIAPEYFFTKENLPAETEKINAAADELLKGITPSMPEFERERLLHDRLAKSITYDLNEKYAHTAYGALVNGRAVCDGYTQAFQYLLQRVGIQSFMVTGTGKGGNHAWNIVRIDGRYYNVDLTWDDQESDTFHAYFNITDERIKEDHAFDTTVYRIPECNSTDANYFAVYGGIFNEFSADDLGALIKTDGKKLHIYITGNMEEFQNNFKKHFRNMLAAAGINGTAGYAYSPLGREMIITVILPGDANCDGVIDIRDIINMKISLSEGIEDINKYWYLNLNADNKINSADLTQLRKMLLEIEN